MTEMNGKMCGIETRQQTFLSEKGSFHASLSMDQCCLHEFANGELFSLGFMEKIETVMQ